jgi:starch phosphorylase
VFGGKAAPGYHLAKLIIKFLTALAEVVNHDPAVNRLLRVVFVPDFNVKTGERIYPATDLSEQISMAGTEASGTGNMKFMMNGAVTVGTLDGANIEIREAAGHDNFFHFGLTVKEVEAVWAAGYHPRELYNRDDSLRGAIDLIDSGLFARGDRELFRPLTNGLLNADPFFVFADFHDYCECQTRVDAAWREPRQWTRMSILNTARCGRFSSDRAIREYAEDIWKVPSLSL